MSRLREGILAPRGGEDVNQPHDLPGPCGPPLIGHLLRIGSQQSQLTLERWAERYGPLFQIRLGRSRCSAPRQGA